MLRLAAVAAQGTGLARSPWLGTKWPWVCTPMRTSADMAPPLVPARGKRIYTRKLDGKQEAKPIALACSEPPAGKKRWTLRLLAEQMVELAVADEVSHETVRQTLKKTS